MNPKDLVALTKVPMWSLPGVGALHGAMATADGIDKYGAYNWREKPIKLMEYIGAMERHIIALKDGEDFNIDNPNVTHLGSIIAGASIILDAAQSGTLIDDRPTPGPVTASIQLEAYHVRAKAKTT